MDILLCASRNMYPQLRTMMLMLQDTQPKLNYIYAIIEDPFIDLPKEIDYDKIIFIDVNNYPKITRNIVNGAARWTYMCFARCYFPDMRPNLDKVLYLDLDLYIDQDISALWDYDLTDYAVAAIVDVNVRRFNLTYIPNINVYFNSGVLLMNLKYMREHDMVAKMDELLNTWRMEFPDQDALNIVCYGAVKYLSHKWNSGIICGYHTEPIINHCVNDKPWDIKCPFFRKWIDIYLRANPQT